MSVIRESGLGVDCVSGGEIKAAIKAGFLGSKLKDGDRVVMIEDVTTSGKSMEETVPKVRGAANVEIVGLMVSLDRMEVGKGGVKCALDEVHDLYGFDAMYGVLMLKLQKKEISEETQKAMKVIGDLLAILAGVTEELFSGACC